MSLITLPAKHPRLPIYPYQPLAKKMTTTAAATVMKKNRPWADPILRQRRDDQEDKLVLLVNDVDVGTEVLLGGKCCETHNRNPLVMG